MPRRGLFGEEIGANIVELVQPQCMEEPNVEPAPPGGEAPLTRLTSELEWHGLQCGRV